MYTKFIKDMAEKHDITYREAESHWKKSVREVEFDVMMDPNKYGGLIANDSMSEEVKRRMEANLNEVGTDEDLDDLDPNTEIAIDNEETIDDFSEDIKEEKGLEEPSIEDMDIDKVEDDIEDAKEDEEIKDDLEEESKKESEPSVEVEEVEEEKEESTDSSLDDTIDEIDSK
jgi:hypothetical protein